MRLWREQKDFLFPDLICWFSKKSLQNAQRCQGVYIQPLKVQKIWIGGISDMKAVVEKEMVPYLPTPPSWSPYHPEIRS